MEHCSKDGRSKIVPECNLPLTGRRAVDLIVSDLGVIACDRAKGGLRLVELAPGVTVADIVSRTAAPLDTSSFS